MKNWTYAGIGSRETPEDILKDMTHIARCLEDKGFDLRSGGAIGADQAFESGAGVQKQIFIPWDNYNGKKQLYKIPEKAFEIAKENHPGWDWLTNGARLLMARNVQQILGAYLEHPTDLVICWTKDGCYDDKQRTKATGGTGLAISIASKHGIPVFNLKRDFHYKFVMERLIDKDFDFQNYTS